MSSRTVVEALISGGKAALLSSFLGGAGLLAYSFLLPDKVVYLHLALFALALISALLGGIQGGMAAGNVGWLHGGGVGALYLFLILIAGKFFIPSLNVSPAGLLFALGVILAGGIGGIVGVNVRFARRMNHRRRYMNY